MNIYHKHHIIPRHMGGSDSRENIIELSIEDHAEAHRILYEKYGKEEDRIAYLALSGQITVNEASILAWKNGSDKGRIAQKELWAERGEWYKINSEQRAVSLKKHYHKNGHHWLGKYHREETKIIIGKKNSISQLGHRNSQFGTMWITNGIENKKIKKFDIIPEGWYKGRVVQG